MRSNNPSQEHTTILQSDEGVQRRVSLAETGVEIGRGAHATVSEVLVDHEPMAKKDFSAADGAERALSGHRILRMNLPEAEVAHLADMELDLTSNSIIMPRLDSTAWVVSMGRNVSAGRTELSANKVPEIPNFNSVVTELMDAVQACGDKCLEIGPDVYFLTVDRRTHELGYIYADTESMVLGARSIPPEEVPLENIYWAAGVLNLFLCECVENPEPYLVRVRQEALHRLNSYGSSDTTWHRELLQGKEFQWPESTWQQELSWMVELVRRQLIAAWNS